MLPLTGFVMALFWAFVVLLVLIGFARVRATLSERLDGRGLGDREIRMIEETGFLHVDDDAEPLDMERIEDEERRFWESEGWDEAEEW